MIGFKRCQSLGFEWPQFSKIFHTIIAPTRHQSPSAALERPITELTQTKSRPRAISTLTIDARHLANTARGTVSIKMPIYARIHTHNQTADLPRPDFTQESERTGYRLDMGTHVVHVQEDVLIGVHKWQLHQWEVGRPGRVSMR